MTDAENSAWEDIKRAEIVGEIGDMQIKRNYFYLYPKAARHFDSYFPNNYLDVVDLVDKDKLRSELSEFCLLLDDKRVGERELMDFINRQRRAYFIVGSILSNYRFGHHGAYLFPEFQIGNTYKVDYLLVGKGSGGWEFVFVELEAPYEHILLKDGGLGKAFRKGLDQIEGWSSWLDANYASLLETFNKQRNKEKSLPDEFMKMDKSRLHFVVVAGRRCEFTEKTYRTQRNKVNREDILILHYDNVIDSARDIIGAGTY